MCFSAPGSFILGSALIGSGACSVKRVKNKAFLPLALIPLFLGIQQVLEGGVWLALAAQDRFLTTLFAFGYLFFALSFGQVWIPLTVYRIEPPGWRKSLMGWFLAVGIIVFAASYFVLLFTSRSLEPTIVNHSISYNAFITAINPRIHLALYVLYAVLGFVPLYISSFTPLRAMALMLTVSVAVSALFYLHAFTSVWCFFAAIISFYVLRIIRAAPGNK